MKELIIIIIILLIIIGGAIYIQNFLNKTSSELISDLNELKERMIIAKDTNNREDIKQKVSNIYKKWNKMEKGWSIIVLHSELDLIETSFIKMKSGIEDGEISRSLEELETNMFLIDHISQKEKFCLKNIF